MGNDNSLEGLEPQIMYVSEEDYKFLVELLEKPPAPNEALLKALKNMEGKL